MKSSINKEVQEDDRVDNSKRSSIIIWLKRIGLAGFLFFLLKGLAWVFFGAVLIKYFGCRQ